MGQRRTKRSGLVTGVMWVAAGALMGWGIWRAVLLWRTMMAERPAEAATVDAGAMTGPAEAASQGVVVENTGAVVVRDEWLEAMTPAAEDEGNAAGWDRGMPVDKLLGRGANLLAEGRVVEGRGALNAAPGALGEDSRAAEVREQLAALNEAVFLGSAILLEDPAARLVEIQEGDSFLKLGQQDAVPAALLETVNPGINSRNLKPGTGVKIVRGPFHVRLVKGARRMDLYARDMYVRSFPAEVMAGDYLPRGTYRVSRGLKIQVGTKQWIGIEGISEESQEVSAGWLYGEAGPRMGQAEERVSGVKLADADLAELYNVLVETRSLLRVVP